MIGSLTAAFSHTIYGLMIGRALQGAGAIGSVILATVADVTQNENRSKAMALIGLSIGGAFALAMVVGPILNEWVGIAGIFWTTAGLAVVAELLTWKALPKISKQSNHLSGSLPKLIHLLKDPQLLRLNAGIFLLHAILTSFFIAVPFLLAHHLNLTLKEQTELYLLVLLLSFVFMTPALIMAEKKQQVKTFFMIAIGLLGFSLYLLTFLQRDLMAVGFLLLIFFTAFTFS